MQDVHDVFLNPGDFHFSGGHTRIRTLLGSCVSIALWHPLRHIGGMCHYMLPSRAARPKDKLDGRYADEAMALFDQEIAKAGTRANEYQAKIFGGGNMFPGKTVRTGFDIGQRNIEMAHSLLAERNIPTIAEHLGGDGHRKLIFDLWSGDAWLAFQETGQDNNGKHTPWPLSK